jgi:SPP1 family predicted phage head-tail adaptor
MPSAMRAGPMRTVLTIEQRTDTENTAIGGATVSWSTYLTCWARALPQAGIETQTIAQRQANQATVFSIRYTPGLSPTTHRVKIGARLFDLVSVVNVDERNRETQLGCVEAVS